MKTPKPSPLRISPHMDLMPWKWEGVVLHGGSGLRYRKWAKDALTIDVSADNGCAAHAYVLRGAPWLLWLADLTDIPSLAHEALHVTAGVLEARGMTLTRESEEAYTYTLEDIIRQTLAVKKWTKV